MSLVYGPYGSLNGDYFARGLGHALRSYRLYDPDWALQRDPEVYEKLRRDPVISFAIRYRKLLARGADWYLEPAADTEQDRLLVKILEDLLKEIQYFDSARYNLAEAIITGSRWSYINGDCKTLSVGGFEPMEWYVCTNLIDIDKRRFRQFPVDGPTGTKEVTYTTVELTEGQEAPTTQVQELDRRFIWQIYRPMQFRWEQIDREDYVRHVHENREEDLQYGAGLASELYTYWYAKEVVLQHGLQYLERWSQGLLLAGVNTLRDGSASAPPSSKLMSDWLAALTNMRSRHVLVFDSLDKVDVKDAPPTGWKAALEAIDYLDGAMRVAILGASLPTSAEVEGGSYALAEVQERTTEVLNKFDHAVIEDSLRRDLLGWLFNRNKTTLDRLGVGNCTLPYVRLRSNHADNHKEWADIIIKARQAGIAIREDEAYARLGLSIPAQGDKCLTSLAEQESLNQGGLGLDPAGGADVSQANILNGDKVVDQVRNQLRPDNKAGPAKPDRERAIDTSTRGFRSRQRQAWGGGPAVYYATEGGEVELLDPRVPPIHVHLPASPKPEAPVVNFRMAAPKAQPAPVVHVHVPEQKAPQVKVDARSTINVPERETHITVPERETTVNVAGAYIPERETTVNIHMPERKPQKLEIERNPDGSIKTLETKPAEER